MHGRHYIKTSMNHGAIWPVSRHAIESTVTGHNVTDKSPQRQMMSKIVHKRRRKWNNLNRLKCTTVSRLEFLREIRNRTTWPERDNGLFLGWVYRAIGYLLGVQNTWIFSHTKLHGPSIVFVIFALNQLIFQSINIRGRQSFSHRVSHRAIGFFSASLQRGLEKFWYRKQLIFLSPRIISLISKPWLSHNQRIMGHSHRLLLYAFESIAHAFSKELAKIFENEKFTTDYLKGLAQGPQVILMLDFNEKKRSFEVIIYTGITVSFWRSLYWNVVQIRGYEKY